VLDWRVWSDDSDYLFLAKKVAYRYQCSLATKPQVFFDYAKHIVSIQGISLDTLCAASASDPSKSEDPDGISCSTRDYWNMWESVRPQIVPYGDKNDQALAFENAFLAGLGSKWIKEPAMTRAIMRRAGEAAAGPKTEALDARYFEDEPSSGNRAVLNRQFFVTDGGYMGYGPKGLQTGDMVVVFLGARVPFVLRSCGNHYLLLGDCCKFCVVNQAEARTNCPSRC